MSKANKPRKTWRYTREFKAKADQIEQQTSVTASFSLAVYQAGTDKKTLLRQAGEVLYQAKRAGKNRVEHVTDV